MVRYPNRDVIALDKRFKYPGAATQKASAIGTLDLAWTRLRLYHSGKTEVWVARHGGPGRISELRSLLCS